MKKVSSILIYGALVFVSHIAYSASLDEIADFAKEICDDIRAEGKITRSEVEVKVSKETDKVKELLKNGSNVYWESREEISEFSGLPFEDLAEEMNDSRQCKRELTKILLKEGESSESDTVHPMSILLAYRHQNLKTSLVLPPKLNYEIGLKNDNNFPIICRVLTGTVSGSKKEVERMNNEIEQLRESDDQCSKFLQEFSNGSQEEFLPVLCTLGNPKVKLVEERTVQFASKQVQEFYGKVTALTPRIAVSFPTSCWTEN